MCGRMTLTRSGSEIAEYFSLAMAEDEIKEMGGEALRALMGRLEVRLRGWLRHQSWRERRSDAV